MNVLLVEEGLVHSQWKEAEAHVAGRVFADHAANKRYRLAIQKQSRIYAARSTWSNGVAYVWSTTSNKIQVISQSGILS